MSLYWTTDHSSWWADEPDDSNDDFEDWLMADQEAEWNSWVEWAEELVARLPAAPLSETVA